MSAPDINEQSIAGAEAERAADAAALMQEAAAAGGAAGAAGAAGAEPAPAVINDQEAAELSRFIVDLVADTASAQHPALSYDDDARERVERALRPVVLKYNGKLPPWLERWKEELILTYVLGSVIYASVRAVKEYEAHHKASSQETAAAPAAA